MVSGMWLDRGPRQPHDMGSAQCKREGMKIGDKERLDRDKEMEIWEIE